MSLKFDLLIDSPNAEDDVYELKEFIDELHISSMTTEIKEIKATDEQEIKHMGAEMIPEILVALASAPAGIAFVKGFFECLKAYILSRAQKGQVILVKGNSKIVFNTDTVKKPQELIDKLIDVLK
jgi:hypothetical protein